MDTDIAGHAHGWVMLPLALLALVALVLGAHRPPPRGVALLVPIGIAVVAISLAVDAPKGLDEGAAAIAYEGATATPAEGFWMQIATGAVLIACGLMLPLLPAPGAAPEPCGPRPSPAAASMLTSRGRARASSAAAAAPAQRSHASRAKRKVQGAGT